LAGEDGAEEAGADDEVIEHVGPGVRD
jgi:hypothetical protein